MFKTGDVIVIDPNSQHLLSGKILTLGKETRPGVFDIGTATETKWDNGQSFNRTVDVVFDASIHQATILRHVYR